MAGRGNGRVTYDRKATKMTKEMVLEILPALYRNAPDAMREAWDRHGDAIMDEIVKIEEHRSADPESHARAALITAILSPGTELDKNIRQARRALDCIEFNFNDVDAIYKCITDNLQDAGGAYGTRPARSLLLSLDFLRNIELDLMTKPALMALKRRGIISGIAHKTGSFAAALYDPYAPVFTLDVHMLRWVCKVVGREDWIAGSMEINDAPYAMLEEALVSIARETLPDAPTFGVQWAIWNEQSQEQHRSHLAIFGIDE